MQLCEVLKESGIEIEGIGSDEIEIRGSEGELLDIEPFKIIADRIEAGTYLCAGAITNSKITVKNMIPSHINAVILKFQEMGFDLDIGEDFVTIKENPKIEPVRIATSEYPGFPTDMQAQFMALATQAEGVSVIEERLFENRFMHVSELQRMGAKITLKGNIATIEGGVKLMGADVMATDLRASSALVLAALSAVGVSNVHRIYHLDRGYENLEKKLTSLGAVVERLSE